MYCDDKIKSLATVVRQDVSIYVIHTTTASSLLLL